MGTTRGRDLGLLLLRTGVGATLAAHGSQKLFGVLGGHGLEGTGAFMDSVGFRPGKLSALLAGLGEFGGGSLMALGLAAPLGGAAGAATMVVASTVDAPRGFWASQGGFELPGVLAAASAAVALTGAGRYSADHVLRGKLAPSWLGPVALGVSLATAAGLAARASAIRSAEAPDGAGSDTPSDEGGSAPSTDAAE